jgi:hypothetical protein
MERRYLRDHIAPHRHSTLLIALIIAFAVRPLIGDIAPSAAVFGVALVLVLLLALYTINVDELVGERGRLLVQTRRRLWRGWVLAATVALERVGSISVHGKMFSLVEASCWPLFLLVTLSQLGSVLKQREVTGETISMAVSIYLLLGLTWVFLYAIIFHLNPDPLKALQSQNQVIPSRFGIYFRCWATST